MSDIITVEKPCRVELECPEGVHPPDASSFELAKYLFNVHGKSVLDVCCGTGILGIVAAKLGARDVYATDSDSAAIECTRKNAVRNEVVVYARTGDLHRPFRHRKFDLVIAHPPQIPAPADAEDPRFAGEDGLRFMEPLVRDIPRSLEEAGQFLTLLGSLADTRRFEEILSERFRFRALPRTRRDFTREEFDGYRPGLFDYLSERRARSAAEFQEEDGRLFYWVRYYMAMLRK